MTDISPVNGITIYPSVKAVIIWGGGRGGVSPACWLPPLSHGSSRSFCQGTHPASSCAGTSLAPNWFNKHQPGRHPAPCYYYVSAAITIRKQEPFRSTNTVPVSLIYKDNNDNDPVQLQEHMLVQVSTHNVLTGGPSSLNYPWETAPPGFAWCTPHTPLAD